MQPVSKDVKKILDKYGQKIEGQSGPNMMDEPKAVFTKDYDTFRSESLRLSNTLYERLCNFSSSILDISPPKEEIDSIAAAIETTHLNITPAGAYSFATLVMVLSILSGIFLGLISYLLFGSVSIVTILIFVIGGAIAVKPLGKYPIHLADMHRLRASNQMVMCILYIVMYMRHTSNLEHAVKFAGEHIGAPLSLDLRKVVWDVETGRFSTMKESIDYYLENWKGYNLDFVESFHLIESSLSEGNLQRRLELLDKALEVMLEGTYENMLHYAQNIKSPITTLHMLGVILPVLGLIILPLMGSFLGVKWYQLAIVYNVFLPIGVYFLGFSIMSKRPVGYSEGNILEDNPRFASMRKMNFLGMEIEPKSFAIFLAMIFLLVGFFPVIYHALGYEDIPISIPGYDNFGVLMGYQTSQDVDGNTIESGPFGIGAALFSLVIVFGIAYSLSAYYKARSRKLIAIREETKKLEKEFQGALFQLGNRIGGGFPTEMSFGDVANNMKGTPTGDFLQIVDTNIRMLGMSVTEAIFDDKVGAINKYPSSLIESSMKVMVETSQKGPSVVSRALISISNYLDRINKVNERLKDLLAETIGSMKAQISFLSPVISGIVVGIGTMITSIIGSLGPALQNATASPGSSAAGSFGTMSQFTELFPIDKLIPPFYFQLVVGLYLIEVVYILTILANGIDSGVDKLKEEDLLARNLYKSVMFYVILAGITMLLFNFLAVMISSRAVTGGGL